MKRKKTNKIFVGTVSVGGGSPISVQSMTKTDTRNASATARQINGLAASGCDIIRVAVPDMQAALALGNIKKKIRIPLIADIHFDWRLGLEALKQGVDCLRINPGNIGASWKVRELVSALKDRNVPVRIGVNAGSLQKDLLRKYGHPTPEALVESAERHMAILEGLGYKNMKVSLKASSAMTTVEAYREFSKRHRYSLHVGVSEAGPVFQGLIKSSIGLGILLSEGIGDTIRVSLTAHPSNEVKAGHQILRSMGLRKGGAEIISCPTCGRCGVDLKKMVKLVEKRLETVAKPVTVAVMGCVVNGPGEAREADCGIASAKGSGIVFKKGKIVARTREEDLIETLMEQVRSL